MNDNYADTDQLLIHKSNVSVLKQLHKAGLLDEYDKEGAGSYEILTLNNRELWQPRVLSNE